MCILDMDKSSVMEEEKEEMVSPEEKYATTTSCHGVQYIATCPKLAAKLLWAAITLASAVGLICWTTLAISSYFQYDVRLKKTTEVSEMFILVITTSIMAHSGRSMMK